MTERQKESFQYIATADLPTRFTSVGGANATINSTSGRRGTGALSLSTPNVTRTGYVNRTFDAQPTWTIGFAFSYNTASTASALPVLTLLDTGTVQVDYRLNADGTISVTRNGTLLGTSTAALSANIYYFIEFKTTINNATGSYEVRVTGGGLGSSGAGLNILSATNVNTRNTTNNSANSYQLGNSTVSASGTTTYIIHDLIVRDGTGTDNSFTNDLRVDSYLPSGNGNYSQWTNTAGNSTNNYTYVNDAAPNGDTTTVSAASINLIDTYQHTAMTHTPTSIISVSIGITNKKSDAGAATLAPVIRIGAVDFIGTITSPSVSYSYSETNYLTSPATLAAWTRTELNAAEIGQKRIL